MTQGTAAIAGIYNQDIAARSATFETTLRTAMDVEERLHDPDRFPTLVLESMGVSTGDGWMSSSWSA